MRWLLDTIASSELWLRCVVIVDWWESGMGSCWAFSVERVGRFPSKQVWLYPTWFSLTSFNERINNLWLRHWSLKPVYMPVVALSLSNRRMLLNSSCNMCGKDTPVAICVSFPLKDCFRTCKGHFATTHSFTALDSIVWLSNWCLMYDYFGWSQFYRTLKLK